MNTKEGSKKGPCILSSLCTHTLTTMQLKNKTDEPQLCSRSTVHKEDRQLQENESRKCESLSKMLSMQLQAIILMEDFDRQRWAGNDDLGLHTIMRILISDEHQQLILRPLSTERRSITN